MIPHQSGIRLALVATLLVLLTGTIPADSPAPGSSPAPGCGERYYVLLFGGKAKWWRPNTAHTWATFVHTIPQADGTTTLETVTISWLPATLHVRGWAFRPEPGANLPLHDTLSLMCRGTGSISLWGPYEIPAERYRRAAEYKQVLDSGVIGYRVIDGAALGAPVNHCVRAVTIGDADLHAATQPQLWFGELITRKVAKGMLASCMLVEPTTTHDWLIPALGIDPHPLTRRQFGDPVTDFLLGR